MMLLLRVMFLMEVFPTDQLVVLVSESLASVENAASLSSLLRRNSSKVCFSSPLRFSVELLHSILVLMEALMLLFQLFKLCSLPL